jgi:NAD(P) transhydrogenase subunit alpha
MLIRVHRETRPGERRVALVPRSVKRLVDAGHEVVVPSEAGLVAGFTDDAYREAGAEVVTGQPPRAPLATAIGPVPPDEAAPQPWSRSSIPSVPLRRSPASPSRE